MDDKNIDKNFRVNFCIGSLVRPTRRTQNFVMRGFDSFPGEYGFHGAVYIHQNLIGIIVEIKELFCHILFDDGRDAWLENTQIENISSSFS